MKKMNRYLLFISLLILTGCSERALTFDRTYPNLAIVDEMREKRQLEIEEEKKNAPKTIRETRPTPRSLELADPNGDSYGYAFPSQYCWEYNYLDCDERMEPKHPDYIASHIFEVPSERFVAKSTIEISIDNLRGAILPYPTRVETYIYDYDKNLQLYHTFEDTKDIEKFRLTLPSESKAHMFLFKVFYTGDQIQGIAYHPILIITE